MIVPVYNALPALVDCIESLCAQTCEDLEIILVDDGSTDGSGAICDEFAAKSERIKVIHKQNSGVSDTRNIGLNNIHGDFLAFCDADDIVPPNAYQNMLIELERTGADMVVGSWTEYNGEEEKKIIPGEPGVYDAKVAIEKIAKDNFSFGGGFPWNKLWRVSAIKEMVHFQPELYVFEDKLWVIQSLKQIETVAIGDFSCYQYYVRTLSLSHNVDEKKRKQRNIDLLKAAYLIYCELKYDNALEEAALYYYGHELICKSFSLRKKKDYSSEMAEMIQRDDKKLFKLFWNKPSLVMKLVICRYFWNSK